jgi:hypothetical protein
MPYYSSPCGWPPLKGPHGCLIAGRLQGLQGGSLTFPLDTTRLTGVAQAFAQAQALAQAIKESTLLMEAFPFLPKHSGPKLAVLGIKP